MRKSLAITSVLLLASAALVGDASADTCDVTVGVNDTSYLNDQITVDTTWGTPGMHDSICLEAPIFVDAGVTLTILPGTIVRGQPRRGTATGAPHINDTPGALIITQGARIEADGAADNPIIMTSAAVDNDQDGACDDGNGDTYFDHFPGYVDSPAGCIAAGTCTTAATPGANVHFCDADPLGSPLPPLDANGNANVALWGGLVLEGKAPINTADEYNTPDGMGHILVEGLAIPGFDAVNAQCGGAEPHDSSGVVRYVSVRHAGDQIASDNELNGITLCGIGDGTIFEFSEVYMNWDDCFEFFGGTVNGNHLVCTYAADDQFDIDDGFQGKLQYLFAVMPFFNNTDGTPWGSDSGDKAGEWDGDDWKRDAGQPSYDTSVRVSYTDPPFGSDFAADPKALGVNPEIDTFPWPPSAVYVSNFTAIGSSPSHNEAMSAAATNLGVQVRHGFAGQLVNSVIVNTSGPCFVVDTSTSDSTTGHNTTDHVGADLVRMVATSCTGSSALVSGAMPPYAAAEAADNGDAWALFQTGQACTANIRATGGGFAGLSQPDPYFDAQTWNSATPYDPRPAGAGADCGAPTMPDRAGDTYRGAFPPSATELWTTGWTVLNLAGQLAD